MEGPAYILPLACTPPGWFYEWFAGMQDAYHRTCSHFSTRSTLGIPEGTVLRTVLTGEFVSILVLVLNSKWYCGIHGARCTFLVCSLRLKLMLIEGVSLFSKGRRCGVLTGS